MTFSELGICPEILEAIEVLGFDTPSTIQERAIPAALKGDDIMGLSHTGSGKTLAFTIPALERIDPEVRGVQVLCLAPTRELAVQICREVDKLALFLDGVSAVPIYGGTSFGPQLSALKRGVQFVVGTPGRINDLVSQGELRTDNISTLILDEADEMLDMGFQDDLDSIIAGLPPTRQTLLFSATMSPQIRNMVERYSKEPTEVVVERPEMTVPTCQQIAYEVVFSSRIEVLGRLIEMGRMKRGLVFANTKRVVDDIVDGLLSRGYAVDRLHGDMPQNLRERVMDSFRKGNLNVLVATDIAARGLDVNDVDTVVNFELPRDPEDYVHRIGRTARAGRTGTAVSFIGRRDFSLLARIERFIRCKMNRERVMTAVQVEESRKESLIDLIKEKAVEGIELPEHLAELDIPREQLLAATFQLLTEKLNREIQPIPEDKPSKFSGERSSEGGKDYMEKGNDWGKLENGTPLFMNGGKSLGIRAKDVVGMLYNEAGAPKGTVGDVKIFHKHTIIEVSKEIAPQIIEKMATCHICGYEVNIREDKGRPEQGAGGFSSYGGRDNRDNRGSRNSYGDRGERGGFDRRKGGDFDNYRGSFSDRGDRRGRSRDERDNYGKRDERGGSSNYRSGGGFSDRGGRGRGRDDRSGGGFFMGARPRKRP